MSAASGCLTECTGWKGGCGGCRDGRVLTCATRAVCLRAIVSGLEAMVLVREFEELQARGGGAPEGWRPPIHKYKTPRNMHPPAAPEPHLLAQMCVTVGVSEVYPLEKAVDEVMCCSVFRMLLPCMHWRRLSTIQ